MTTKDNRIHEVTFCSRVAKWSEAIFAANPEIPFQRVEIEESKGIRRKRSDLRVYDRQDRLVLAGEVKLPGTPEGRNAHDSGLIEDAFQKADYSGAQFFFSWNVNQLVLFDRSLWHKPLFERRVRDWDLGLALDSAEDVARPEVEAALVRFLTEFYTDLAAIATGQKLDWGLPPDEYFIRAFESHVAWPVKLTAEYLDSQASSDKGFDHRLQEWMAKEQGWLVARNDPKTWRMLVDRAARTLCYVFANRLIFYESIRVKFEDLPSLTIPKQVRTGKDSYLHFQKRFQQAVEATGDYETLFYPLEMEKEWAGPHIFQHRDAGMAWRSVLDNIKPFNFKLIPSDILGGIFKRLIAPEERHKFGQHYTSEDLVDVVNAFCIRSGTDIVLDPACGSGSFLVRACERKAWLDSSQSHQARLEQIYGADIALFAAHLATLNLAARDVREEENYPRIARRNFFEVTTDTPFCRIPAGLRGERRLDDVLLPRLNAIVGNPPYVRQELITRRSQKGVKPMQAKEDLQELCSRAWPGLKLSGRSDLHCYFWPAATRFLVEDGWFGFLVSSSWLDVEYGFDLQAWVLSNFKLHAIIESTCEPWFEDARVKTCAVILQRCDNAEERMSNLVKFVRLRSPLAAILGPRPDENARQKAAEKFRKAILSAKADESGENWRIIVKRQSDLWQEGLRAGQLFARKAQRRAESNKVAEEPGLYTATAAPGNGEDDENGNGDDPSADIHVSAGGYGGGKWGKYLRAPGFYFHIIRDYGQKFVPLGEITDIRRGVTSGCDAFFMPRDVSQQILDKYTEKNWRDAPIFTACKRSAVVDGKVKLMEAGDGTVHPIETEFLTPEVHSLMQVSRPMITAKELDRHVLHVSQPLSHLRGRLVARYLRYGETQTFTSKKSQSVPVALRSTCAVRDPWYDLTGAKPGHLIWPKSQQYRHVVIHNIHSLFVNCNLYDVFVADEKSLQPEILAAVLNSTLVALFKTFYGRYAGTEGNLKTEIVDVNLLEVPDPRGVSPAVARKLRDAFRRLCQRDTMPLVEEEFMDCHSSERARQLAEKPVSLPKELQMPDRRALDLAVLELLGVADANSRDQLCDQLYHETAAHFRAIRVVEIQKQEQRSRTEGRGFVADDMAKDLWDTLSDDEKTPLTAWLTRQFRQSISIAIPDGKASLPEATDMLDATTVFFKHDNGKGNKASVVALRCPSRAHAEIVHHLAQEGIKGSVALPQTAIAAAQALDGLVARRATIHVRADQLARSRSSDQKYIGDIASLLEHWMIHGQP